jgi:hypothetical protein
MKLSEVPFEKIYIGQRVQSDATNRIGIIIEKQDIKEDYRNEDNIISIWWDNGNMSIEAWHFQCNKVTVLEFIDE